MTQFSDERGAEMRELFLETAQELLQALNDEALKLEKHPTDVEAVRSIRRIVHTLKGDAAACSYRELGELAHHLEDALALERLPSPATLAEVTFTAADTFGAMLACYRRQLKLPSAEPLRKMIQALGQPAKVREANKKQVREAPQAMWTEYEKLAMQNARAQSKRVYHITALVDPGCAMPIAARQLLLNVMDGVGEVLGTRPENDLLKSGTPLQLLVASHQPAGQLTAKCRIPSVIAQVSVEVLQPPALKAEKAVPEQQTEEAEAKKLPVPPGEAGIGVPEAGEDQESAAQVPSGMAAAENILRVDAERIDNVLNLVGELIIGKSMLQQAFHEFAKYAPKEALRGRFADAIAFQARVLNDLQRSVMKIRMVPVEQLFRRFPRVIRDVAKQCGKQVELVISGQDTDLDKGLLDAIAEPLAHLVRNAVSHGIEAAAERGRSGKPAQGTIRLDAYHHGNQVIIEVSDDGRGIDAPKLKAKAVEQRLLTLEQADRLSEADTLDLVFRPGVSTAEEITEVSGRGVGLDVVESVLHRLKGTVEIETRAGQGTTFRMKLPLTLAIIKALLFRVEQRLYAIPLNTVAEIARAQESDLHQVDHCEVLQLRNQVLPVVRLGRPAAERAEPQPAKIFVLVVTLGERKLGLAVDALEGEEELVIKALDEHTVETDLVSGASILGDGRVVLIVNLIAIVERYAKSRPQLRGQLISGILLSHADRARIARRSAEVRP